jgi:hypothetical protein
VFRAIPVGNVRIYAPLSSWCKSKASATLSITNWFFLDEIAACPLLWISSGQGQRFGLT